MTELMPLLPIPLRLYGTSECHLCELALAHIQPFIDADICSIETVDIVNDMTIYERYAVSIPVLCNPITQSELCWPFDGPVIQLWLQHELQRYPGK